MATDPDLTQKTRSFITNLFNSVGKDSFGQTFRDALSDDLIWHATGSSPLAGIYHSKQEYLDKVLYRLHDRLATPVKPEIRRVIVEGEWASVYFESKDVKGKNGADFSMQYVWLVRVVEEKILEVVGFYDQKKMWDLFADG